MAAEGCVASAEEVDEEAHEDILRRFKLCGRIDCLDIYLAFDLAETDLDRAIRMCAIEEAHYGKITCHVLRALKYLHAAQLLHRDVKPSNILLTSGFDAKLCDFGMVRFVGPYPRALTEYVGMRWYRAPEVLLGSQRYGPAVDVWSLGCVVGEMALGRALLPGVSAKEQLELILGLLLGRSPTADEAADVDGIEHEAADRLAGTRPCGETLEQRLRSAPAVLRGFVARCLQLSPSSRPSARDLLLTHALVEGHRNDDDDAHWTEQVTLALRDDVLHRPSKVAAALRRAFVLHAPGGDRTLGAAAEFREEHQKSSGRSR